MSKIDLNRERIRAQMRETCTAIGRALAPNVNPDNPQETLESLIGVQGGLAMALEGNISALHKTNIINENDFADLTIVARKLSLDLQKSIRRGLGSCKKPDCEACAANGDDWSDTSGPRKVH